MGEMVKLSMTAGAIKELNLSNKIVFIPKKDVDKIIKKLIEWGKLRQSDNTIYSLSTDELNDDWIEKLKELMG